MRPTLGSPRSLFTLGFVLATLVAAAPFVVQAGPQLGPHGLVDRCDAVALVQVKLLSKTARVKLVKWLTPVPDGVDAGPDGAKKWLGICLPGRETLIDMRTRYRHFKEGYPLWRRALRRGRYQALVFLRRRAGEFKSMCEVETLHARHWTAHPDHERWRGEIMSAIAAKWPPTTGETPDIPAAKPATIPKPTPQAAPPTTPAPADAGVAPNRSDASVPSP